VSHLVEQARTGPKGVLPTVALLEPWMDHAKRAARRATEQEERADAVTEANEQLRGELDEYKSRARALEQNLAQARAEAQQAEEQLEAERIHHRHDMTRLRAQIGTALSG